MSLRGTFRGGARVTPSDVTDWHGALQQVLYSWPHESPSPHVLRLLLNPYNLLRVFIARENIGDLPRRERIKLLYADQSHLMVITRRNGLRHLIENLTRTERDPLDGLRVLDPIVIQNFLEMTTLELRTGLTTFA